MKNKSKYFLSNTSNRYSKETLTWRDTPAVDQPVFGRTPFVGCLGDTIMIGNYMNYSHDDVMNIFTKDQVARMHYVLINHKGRNSLVSSPVL